MLKNYIKSMVLTLATSGLLLAGSALAADVKIGIVDVQSIMKDLPQRAALIQALQNEFKDDAAEIQKLQTDIKYNQEKAKRDGALMNDEQKENLNKKLGDLITQYQEKAKALQQNSQVRENEELNKLFVVVQKAVDDVATKENFDVILHQQAIIFAKEGTDISQKVIEKISNLK
jgi:outer membrane protein